MIGLNIFYSEEKDWAWHTTQQCPCMIVQGVNGMGGKCPGGLKGRGV